LVRRQVSRIASSPEALPRDKTRAIFNPSPLF